MTAVAHSHSYEEEEEEGSGVPPANLADEAEQHQSPVAPRKTKHWFRWIPTDDDLLFAAERKVLDECPELATIETYTIAGVNTLSLRPQDVGARPTQNANIVLIHGFAGGIGLWIDQLVPLAKAGYDVHAIDLPGFGRSARTWPVPKMPDAAAVVAFFLAPLQEWRVSMGFGHKYPEKLIVVGHSFGAYLAARWALQHPHHIDHLILADPWGVPHDDVDEKKVPLRWRLIKSLAYNLSPLSLLRATGPWGPTLLPRARPDMIQRWGDHGKVMSDYIYHCNAQRQPTGEHAFIQLCKGFGFAKEPLLDLLPQRLAGRVRLSVIYGARSWMNVSKGRDMVAELWTRRQVSHAAPAAEHQSSTIHLDDVHLAESGRTDTGSSVDNAANPAGNNKRRASFLLRTEQAPVDDVICIPLAGHQVFTDAPMEFNAAVLRLVL